MATSKRYVVLVFSMFENFFHSAIIYGWPSIVYVFKDMGYYSDLCPVTNSSGNISTTLPPTMEMTTLLDERVDDDGDDPVTCDEQDASLLLIYTIASGLLPCSMIIGGILFEQAGTLVSRITFSVLLLFAYLCIAASSPEMPNLLYPGTAIMGIAGIIVYISSIEVGNLFPASKSTIIGIETGCCDASAFVFLLVKVAYDFGVPLNVSFYILAGSTAMFLVNTLLLPRHHIPWPLPENYQLEGRCSSSSRQEEDSSLNKSTDSQNVQIAMYSDKSTNTERSNGHTVKDNSCLDAQTNACDYENPGFENDEKNGAIHDTCAEVTSSEELVDQRPAETTVSKIRESHDEKAAEAEYTEQSESFLAALDKLAEEKRNEDYPTIWAVLKSPLFILMTLWAVFCQGYIFFVIGIMNSWLTWLADGDMDTVSYYTNVYSFVAFTTILVTPLVGRFIDRNRHGLGNISISTLDVSERGPYTELKESWLPVLCSCILAVIMAGLMLIPILPVQYATFAIFVGVRSMFYATSAAIVPISFPMHFYPSIFGLANFIAGVFSFVQFPLFILIQDVLDNDPRWVIAGFLIANAAMLILPAYIYVHGNKREKMYLEHIKNIEAEETKQKDGELG